MPKLLAGSLCFLLLLAAPHFACARESVEFGDLVFEAPDGWQVNKLENILIMYSPDRQCFYRLAMLETAERSARPYAEMVRLFFDSSTVKHFEDTEIYKIEGYIDGLRVEASVNLRDDVRNGMVAVEFQSWDPDCMITDFGPGSNLDKGDYTRMLE